MAEKNKNKELFKEADPEEIKKSKDEIHQEMVDIALLASEKILEREVSSSDNQKRVDSFIKDIQSN